MKVLLDTCTFLWICVNDPRLSRDAREIFENGENELYLSSVSGWEISQKHALGKLPLPEKPDVFVPRWRRKHRIDALPLDESASLHVYRLPAIHRDPFDRMLVCQAIVHGLVVLTPDPEISQYAVRTIW